MNRSGHRWGTSVKDDRGLISTCDCGAWISLLNPKDNAPGARLPCPLADKLTDEQLDALCKKHVSKWTAEEREMLSESVKATKIVRQEALEPFAKIAERFMPDAVDRGLSDDAEYYGHEITVGMLRAAHRAWSRRT